MKKQLPKLVFVLTLILGTTALAFAEQPAALTVNSANGSSLEKLQEGLQGVKDSAVDLINVKNEQNLSAAEKEKEEFNLRLEVLRRVIALAEQETASITNQLKNAEDSTEKVFAGQREQLLKQFESFAEFYKQQKQNLENSEALTLADIKDAAQSLKEWREKNYSPIFEQATDFLLLRQQKFIGELTAKRYQKISVDLKKLKKFNANAFEKTEKMLERAAAAIDESRNLGQQAEQMFLSAYININKNATSTASSSILLLTTSTSSPEIKTESQKTENQNLSIKNLVGQSLNKIKETYRIFIEMSDSVKKLLI